MSLGDLASGCNGFIINTSRKRLELEEERHPSTETEAVEQMKDNIERLMTIMGDDVDLPDNVFSL